MLPFYKIRSFGMLECWLFWKLWDKHQVSLLTGFQRKLFDLLVARKNHRAMQVSYDFEDIPF